MSDTVIRVENLGKKYIIGHQKQQPYTALRDVISERFNSFSRNLLKPFGKKIIDPDCEEFWALKDVSFEIKQGEAVGIIGHNGAGKSTLLKIISRITEPTNGRVFIKGRVASLLEVGTGFHPELTGRENIYLNGAILGMNKMEIKNKFEEIVAFAEVEKFLDTPVKRYSSGMYVRLAFAVAAHLEPEILLVDEVLAVGDVAFQKKCLGKMGEVATREGRTVIFVSHNLGAVRALCKTAILLSKGTVTTIDRADKVVEQYLTIANSKEKIDYILSKCGRFELKMPYWIDAENQPVVSYCFGDNYKLRYVFNFFKPVSRVNIGVAIVNKMGERIMTSHSIDDDSFEMISPLIGEVVIDCELNLTNLAPGKYQALIGVRDEYENNAIYLDNDLELTICSSKNINGNWGILLSTGKWKIVNAQMHY